MTDRGRAANTIRGYSGDVGQFAAASGDFATEQYEQMAARFLRTCRGVVPFRTYNRRLSSLRSYGMYLGLGVVLATHTPLKGPHLKAHPLENGMSGVIQLANSAGDPLEAAVIALCGLTGARVSESVSVRYRDLNLRDETIMLGGKHGQWRAVPIWKQAQAYIMPVAVEAYMHGPDAPLIPRSESWARGVVKRLAADCGMDPEVSSHWLRMTFGSVVYGRTKDLRLTQELLGHAKAETTQGYTHVPLAAMRRAVEFDNENRSN